MGKFNQMNRRDAELCGHVHAVQGLNTSNCHSSVTRFTGSAPMIGSPSRAGRLLQRLDEADEVATPMHAQDGSSAWALHFLERPLWEPLPQSKLIARTHTARTLQEPLTQTFLNRPPGSRAAPPRWLWSTLA
jgi:hypothetical protein